LQRSPLSADDSNRIPFTLLVPNWPTTFMEHKLCVVHIAREAAESMTEFMGKALASDHDVGIGCWQVAGVRDIGRQGEAEQERRTAAASV